MAEMPEYASELGYDAGRLYGDEVLAMARATSTELFGTEQLVKDFFRPYLYLDATAIANKGLDRAAVARDIARELEKQPGIGGAIASAGITQGSATGVAAAVRHNHHPQRSGDVYLFQRPYWFMFDRGAVAAMHGSPWRYDTHVPIIFAGPGVEAGRVQRPVHPIDIAPTISSLLNIAPPAAAEGSVLIEVLNQSP